MHRRKWDARTKAIIVIESLKGKPVAEICHDHQISQELHSQWLDRFLAHAAKALSTSKASAKPAWHGKMPG